MQATWTNHDVEYNHTCGVTRRGAPKKLMKVFFVGSKNIKKEGKKSIYVLDC